MLNIAGIIVVIIVLIFLIYFLRNKSLDTFIVFLEDIVIPSTCYDYLLYNGKNYFILNSKKIIDGITNPIQFNSKEDATSYLNSLNCPINIPYVDLVMRKKIDDPTVSYQRECSKKVAPNLFDLDICGVYGSDNDILTNTKLARINKIENDKKIYSNYDIETCMINKAVTEDESLDDTNFKSNFAQYFDRLNSNIDAKYLYISGR
jgi:hypothetical protein